MVSIISTCVKHFLLLCLIFLITASFSFGQERGAARANSSEENLGKTRALIIGVSDYPNLEKEMQLDYAHKDALLFKDLLLSMPEFVNEEDISILLNDEATNYNTIISKFVQILTDSEEGDLVILFFAGHGDIQNVLGKDDGFLLLNQIDLPKITDYHANTEALPISSIKDYTSRVTSSKGVKVMLVFDACHSGKLVSSEENSKIVLSALSQEMQNTFNIVSAQQDELSYEDSKWGGGHGVFTWFLVNGAKGLADQNKDGSVTLMELRNYVQNNVLNETGDKQLPLINGNDREKIFLVEDLLMAEAEAELEKGLSKINASLEGNELAMNSKPRGKSRGLTATPHPELFKSLSTVMLTRQLIELLLEGKIFPVENEDKISEDLILEPIKANNNLMIDRAHRKNTSAISSSILGTYIATSGEEGLVKLWNYEDHLKIGELSHKWVKALAFSDDEKYLASGGSREVKLWDVRTHELIHNFKGHKSSISAIKFDPSGKFLISVAEDGLINVWDVSNKTLKATLKHPKSRSFTSLVFGLVPNHFYTSDNSGNVILWDIETGSEVKKINTGSNIESLAFALGSNQLVVGFRNGKVNIYNAENFNLDSQINLDINNLRSVITDPSGNFIAGGGKLWKYPIYDNRKEEEIYSQVNIPRGITDGHYNSYHKEVFLSLNGGGWMSVKFDIPEKEGGESVYKIYNDEVSKLESETEKEQINTLIINNIIARAAHFLKPYINSEPLLPSWNETTKIKNELEWAAKINNNDDFLSHKLSDYLLLSKSLEAIISGDFSQLNESLDNLLLLKKNNPDASYVNCLIAEVYQKMKRLQEAKNEANNAADKIPDWVEPKLSIAYTLFLEKNYKEADNIVAHVIEEAPSLSKAYVQRAKIKSVIGYYNQAKDLFEKALQMDVSNVSYLLDYGLFLLKNGELNQAELIADKIRLINDSYYGSYFLDAELQFYNYLQQSNTSSNETKNLHEEAYSSYLKAHELGSNIPEVNLRLANFYANMIENKDLLKENYLNIPMAESINTDSRRSKAIAKIASDHYEEVLKGNPFMCSANVGNIEMRLHRSSNKKTRKKILKSAKDIGKKTSEDCYCQALYYEGSGNDKKANKYIEKSISLDQENVFYYIKLLDLMDIDKSSEAIEYLKANYPGTNTDYFSRKKITAYSFFNFN